uniref:Uncharacterized protein n=1 Tax=Rhizophora mucronata TaxID=61149 RepID=A0A2P2IJF1_RHIMU
MVTFSSCFFFLVYFFYFLSCDYVKFTAAVCAMSNTLMYTPFPQ